MYIAFQFVEITSPVFDRDGVMTGSERYIQFCAKITVIPTLPPDIQTHQCITVDSTKGIFSYYIDCGHADPTEAKAIVDEVLRVCATGHNTPHYGTPGNHPTVQAIQEKLQKIKPKTLLGKVIDTCQQVDVSRYANRNSLFFLAAGAVAVTAYTMLKSRPH